MHFSCRCCLRVVTPPDSRKLAELSNRVLLRPVKKAIADGNPSLATDSRDGDDDAGPEMERVDPLVVARAPIDFDDDDQVRAWCFFLSPCRVFVDDGFTVTARRVLTVCSPCAHRVLTVRSPCAHHVPRPWQWKAQVLDWDEDRDEFMHKEMASWELVERVCPFGACALFSHPHLCLACRLIRPAKP